MKKVFYSLMLGLAIVACEPAEYDDSALVERMDELEGKVEKIAEDLATLQGNVDALKSLSQALKDGKYITEVAQDEETGNYTITFSNGDSIVIEKGEQGIQGDQGIQGEQGNSVTVSEVDGALYWNLEGYDPIPVYKANPVFSSEEGKLYVQFEGEEKYEVGTLTGKSSFFEDVKYDEAAGTVTFTLAEQFGGQSFTLAVTAFSLNISTTVGVKAGAVVDIPYTVLGANDKTVVDAFSSGAYVAEVVAKDAASGVVKVTVPNPLTAGNVLVWADNGEGKTSIRKISFSEEKYEVTPVAAAIPVAGGTIEVKGFSNVEFDVKSDKEWLTVVSVKAGDFTITLSAEENTGDARTATVSLLRAGTETVLTSFEVSQEGKAAEAAKELKRIWGKYSTNTFWYTFGVDAQWLTQMLDRGMTMDNENLYVAKCTAYASKIVAFPINGGEAFDVNVEGLASNGKNHYSVGVSLNVIKNGNDYILLATNLKNEDNFELWAWINGVASAPTKIVDYIGSYLPGASEITKDWRRYGDRITVVGDWSNGEIWLASWSPSKTLVYTIENGVVSESARPKEHMIDATDNIKEVVVYPGVSDEVMITANGIAKFYKDSGTANENGWKLWNATGEDYSTDLALTYGYEFFEMNGKKYIAYTKVEGLLSPKARLVVIEDGDGTIDGFKKALTDHVVAWEFPLQSESDFSANAYQQDGVAGNSLGNCCVIESADATYIGAHAQGIGLSLFKFE